MHRSQGWRKASTVGTRWLRERKKGTWRRRHRPIKWELVSLGSMVWISIPSKDQVWRTKAQLVTLLGVAKPLCLLWWSTQSTVSGTAWGGWGVALLKVVCQWGGTLRLKAPAFFQFPLSALYLSWTIWALSFLLWLSCVPDTSFPCPDRLYPSGNGNPNQLFILHLPCLGQDALSQQQVSSRHT